MGLIPERQVLKKIPRCPFREQTTGNSEGIVALILSSVARRWRVAGLQERCWCSVELVEYGGGCGIGTGGSVHQSVGQVVQVIEAGDSSSGG